MAFPDRPVASQTAANAVQEAEPKYKIRFAVIGVDHNHIDGITDAIRRGAAAIPKLRAPLGIRVMRHGYVRVDWFTPDKLGVWGDGRLFLLGTDGYIEVRKYIDVAGRPRGNHLFLVDNKQARYIDCNNVSLPFGPQFVADIVSRHTPRKTRSRRSSLRSLPSPRRRTRAFF